MATVVDALLVTLGLDTAGMAKGSKDAEASLKKVDGSADKTKKNLDDMGKRAAQALNKIKNEVLSLAAAYIGASAIKSFASRITQSDAALGRFSTNVGMSTEALSAWQGVADRAGGSADSLASDVRGLVQQVQRFSLTGEGGESFRYFRAMGITLTDTAGKMRPMSELLLQVADKFQGMDPTKAQAIGAGMGLSEGTINVLMKGRTALQGMLAEQEKAGVATRAQTDAAAKLHSAWTLMGQSATGVGRNLMTAVTPVLIKVLGLVNDLLGYMQQHMPESTVLLGAMVAGFAALAAVKLIGIIGSLSMLTGGLGAAAGAAGGLLGVIGKLGLGAGAAWGVYEIAQLGKAALGYHDAVTRKGVTLTPQAAARAGVAGGGATGAASLFSGLEKQYGLPAGLLDSMWAQESGRGKNMRSSAGALGDFQLMPGTAKQYGVQNPMDLTQSATGAAHMMADLLKQANGNLPLALAMYNWGAGNVQKKGMANAPLETLKYAPSVMARMANRGGTSNTSSSDVRIAQITVNTQATDAKGIASSIGSAVSNQSFVAQANTGLF